MNELLWFAFIFIDLSLALCIFKFFGRSGMYALIVFNLLLCNIQVLKTIELFGLTTTLGNILYASIFFTTDLLSEFYGKKDAQKGVYLGFIAMVMTTLYMQLALQFVPASDDFIQPHLEAIFSFFPRIVLASLAAYFVSQLHDVWAYHFWHKRTNGRHLWLRNNASTCVSQLLDSVIFCSIAFAGVFPWDIWWEILFSTYVLKLFVALIDTPFIYLARYLYRRKPQQPQPCSSLDAN